MYIPGNIIYFDPFYFKNGMAAKPKYFLVLKVVGGNAVLASLPSSKIHLPSHIDINHGCVEVPSGNINCYVFKANSIITTNNWAFPMDTFLYGQWLDEYDVAILADIYPVEGIDYQVIGQLTSHELNQLIHCFANSASVKRKFKRLLS